MLEELDVALTTDCDDDDDDNEDDDDDTDDEFDDIGDVLANLANKEETGVGEDSVINAEVYDNQCTIWKLPFEINQGSVGGRNGSSACSIIALIIGHVVHAQHIEDPVVGPLGQKWITLLVRCMELGNKVYDEFRENLPSRYLSTAEACDVLSQVISLIPSSPLPVRLVDSHQQSTVAIQLQLLLDDATNKFAVFTISHKSSVFIFRPPSIFFVDSHCHFPDGAVIVKGNRDSIDEFCQRVWLIGDFQPEMYGNLVLVYGAD